MGIQEVDLRYQATTEKTPWTIHEVVITVTEYDKYLICESNFSRCQNEASPPKLSYAQKQFRKVGSTFSTQFETLLLPQELL